MGSLQHIVQSGDNLSKIAYNQFQDQGIKPSSKDLQAAVKKIAIDSGIADPDKIYPGQKIDLSSLNLFTVKYSNPKKSTQANRFASHARSTSTSIPTKKTKDLKKAVEASAQEIRGIRNQLLDATKPGGKNYRNFENLLKEALKLGYVSESEANDYRFNRAKESIRQATYPENDFYTRFDNLIDENLENRIIPSKRVLPQIIQIRRDRTIQSLTNATDPNHKLYPRFEELLAVSLSQGVIDAEDAKNFRLDWATKTLDAASNPENELYTQFNELLEKYLKAGIINEGGKQYLVETREQRTLDALGKACDLRYKLSAKFEILLGRAKDEDVIDKAQAEKFTNLRNISVKGFFNTLESALQKSVQEDVFEFQRLYTYALRTNKDLKKVMVTTKSGDKISVSDLFDQYSRKAYENSMLKYPKRALQHAAQAILNGNRERGEWIINTLHYHGRIDDDLKAQFLENTQPSPRQYIEEGPEIVSPL
jgi:hypothetical protein